MIQAQLEALLLKIEHKAQLEKQTQLLRQEILELIRQTNALHSAMLAEQSDVDKLEAGGIGTVFHKLIGRMEEKLDKERLEAKTAADEYHTAAAQLDATQAHLSDAEQELNALQNCRSQYIQLMLDRIHQLESDLNDPENAEKQDQLKHLLQLERRRKSLREALLEADEAHRAACQNLNLLLSTRQEADLSKLEKLAQFLLEEVSDLQAKLAQMGIDPQPHISIGPYLKAPSAFLVVGASDSSAEDLLTNAVSQIQQLQEQISAISEKLTAALTQIESAISKF